jgi:hypothetical protein
MKTLIVILILVLSGCNSPVNHQIPDTLRKSQSTNDSLAFKEISFTANVTWLKGPFGNINMENSLLVILSKGGLAQSLPEGKTLEFYATMPSMGHPMEDAGYFEELEPGIYVNRHIRYNMPGDWENELWIMDSDYNVLDSVKWRIFF